MINGAALCYWWGGGGNGVADSSGSIPDLKSVAKVAIVCIWT